MNGGCNEDISLEIAEGSRTTTTRDGDEEQFQREHGIDGVGRSTFDSDSFDEHRLLIAHSASTGCGPPYMDLVPVQKGRCELFFLCTDTKSLWEQASIFVGCINILLQDVKRI
jgi:hypothetical protein